MTTALYVPGTSEQDMSKVIMSAQLVAGQTATNTDAITTANANITTNTSAITALQAGPLVSGAVAAKSDQTTATSTTLAVTPGRQQFHPSAAKAWANFVPSPASLNASFNVTSVSRTSAGLYVVTFTTAFTTANFTSHVTCFSTTGSGILAVVNAQTTTTVTINTFNTAGSSTDPTTAVMLACFGTQ